MTNVWYPVLVMPNGRFPHQRLAPGQLVCCVVIVVVAMVVVFVVVSSHRFSPS